MHLVINQGDEDVMATVCAVCGVYLCVRVGEGGGGRQ